MEPIKARLRWISFVVGGGIAIVAVADPVIMEVHFPMSVAVNRV
jgi:hypothetical protein